MPTNNTQETPTITCVVCNGHYKTWYERTTGVYSTVYCRWCAQGKMSVDVAKAYGKQEGSEIPFTIARSDVSGLRKRVATPLPGTTANHSKKKF